MSPSVSRKRSPRAVSVLQRPRGVIHPRVQKVGPQHFGIVAVDPAKKRSKWILTDFYGNVLVPPTWVEHDHLALDAALATLEKARQQHDIRDLVVAVERTGRYHHPLQRAFVAAGLEVRIVHPLISRHFRQMADPQIKTDDKDLGGIDLAAINGFALQEKSPPTFWQQLQLLTRHRRDLVAKASTLCCQIKEHLESALPGYAACFYHLWDNPSALALALQYSTEDLRQATRSQLRQVLEQADLHPQDRTLDRILQWAKVAPAPDPAAAIHRQIAGDLERDRQHKQQEIQALERQIALLLAQCPYVLLLSIPGINVVSAAEYAGEMGPICHYANARCITGRAGLYPARYQSDQVDYAGRLVKCANRRLRYALLVIADNLSLCNDYFARLAERWRTDGDDPRLIRVRIAQRFSRISFQMLAGQQVFHHPAVQTRDYILRKLITFHHAHQTPPLLVQKCLHQALGQLPRGEYAAEALPLQEELTRIQAHRRRGPQVLGEILPSVLAALGAELLQSLPSGAADPA